jgi:hypothetical protein
MNPFLSIPIRSESKRHEKSIDAQNSKSLLRSSRRIHNAGSAALEKMPMQDVQFMRGCKCKKYA